MALCEPYTPVADRRRQTAARARVVLGRIHAHLLETAYFWPNVPTRRPPASRDLVDVLLQRLQEDPELFRDGESIDSIRAAILDRAGPQALHRLLGLDTPLIMGEIALRKLVVPLGKMRCALQQCAETRDGTGLSIIEIMVHGGMFHDRQMARRILTTNAIKSVTDRTTLQQLTDWWLHEHLATLNV